MALTFLFGLVFHFCETFLNQPKINRMRKIFTFPALALFVFCSTEAQVINKGDRLFGGGLSLTFFNVNSNGSQNNYGNVALIPSYSWGVKQNQVFGLKGSINYGRNETQTGTAGTRTISNFVFGPGIFLKKYREWKNRFGIYFSHELNGSYALQREKYSSIPDRFRTSTWGANYTFSPGVFYKFSENFIGEANIGGVYANYSSGNFTRAYGLGASFLQYFNLGFNYRIPRRNS